MELDNYLNYYIGYVNGLMDQDEFYYEHLRLEVSKLEDGMTVYVRKGKEERELFSLSARSDSVSFTSPEQSFTLIKDAHSCYIWALLERDYIEYLVYDS